MRSNFHLPGAPKEHIALQRFVTMTGGEYFVASSISAVRMLAAG